MDPSTAKTIIIVSVIVVGIFILYQLKNLFGAVKRRHPQMSSEQIASIRNIDRSALYTEKSLKNLESMLMVHIKRKVKDPESTIMCPASELRIDGPKENGKFKITGYVNSKNGLGLMVRADFSAIGRFNPNTELFIWDIESVWLTEKN